MKKEIGNPVLLFVLCAATSIMNPKFLSPVNLVNTAKLIGLYGMFSLSLGLVIIAGGINHSLNFTVMGSVVPFGVLADQIFKNRSAEKIPMLAI